MKTINSIFNLLKERNGAYLSLDKNRIGLKKYLNTKIMRKNGHLLKGDVILNYI
jgi:hypothetical protein